MSSIMIRGLSAGYDQIPVLEEVSLTVAAGTTTAVLGASGGGKTTLLRAIAGFLRPAAGRIVINDRVLSDDTTFVAPHRRPVGYVRQDGTLFPHLDVAGNITFGLSRAERRRAGVSESCWISSAWRRISPAGIPPSSRAANSSESPWLGRWPAAPRWCCSTNRSPPSMPPCGPRRAELPPQRWPSRAPPPCWSPMTRQRRCRVPIRSSFSATSDWSRSALPLQVYGDPADPDLARFLGEAVVLPGQAYGGVAHCALGAVRLAQPADGQVLVVLRPEQIRLSSELDETATGATTTAGVVRDVAYYGHDTMLELELVSTADRVFARLAGAPVPAVGTRASLHVDGTAKAFPSE